MPALLRVGGYRFFFYSLENQEPPHIHVAHSGRYAKYSLDPVAPASKRGFRDHELTTIRRLVEVFLGEVECLFQWKQVKRWPSTCRVPTMR